MKQLSIVYRWETKLFFTEKLNLLPYFVGILFLGLIIPSFLRDGNTIITSAYLFTFVQAKPLLAGSFAAEREKKTIESLLTTRLSSKSIFLGKSLFCSSFCMVFFLFTLVLAQLGDSIFCLNLSLIKEDTLALLLSACISFVSFSLLGTYYSAKSETLYLANHKLNVPLVLWNLFFLVEFACLQLHMKLVSCISISLFLLFHICLFISILRKDCFHHRWSFYEMNSTTNTAYFHLSFNQSIRSVNHFSAILRHEFKYLMTLKSLLFSFFRLSFAPAIVLCVMRYYTGSFDLNYALLLVTLLIPRIPVNLIAYSVGGEKVYKTGESLLSTPVKSSTILLAKACVPMIVSGIVLLLATNITLLSMPIYNYITKSNVSLPRFTLAYGLLFYGASFLSSVIMILLTAILCLHLKTPRQGLYFSSMLGIVFVPMVASLLYLLSKHLVACILYLLLLVGIIIALILSIRAKLNRPYMLSRLM